MNANMNWTDKGFVWFTQADADGLVWRIDRDGFGFRAEQFRPPARHHGKRIVFQMSPRLPSLAAAKEWCENQ